MGKWYEEAEVRRERLRRAMVWATAAESKGLDYALTINPDRYQHPGEDAAGFIHGLAKNLFRKMNRDLRGLSRRRAEFETDVDFLGVFELKDKRGLVYPHGHFALSLEPDEDFRLMMLMDECWGSKRTTSSGDVFERAPRPLSEKLGRQAQYEIKPIWAIGGWARYVHKQIDNDVTELDVYPRQFIRGDAA